MVLIVVIGRSGENDKLCRTICRSLVRGGVEVEFPLPRPCLSEETINLIILDRADELVELLSLGLSGCDGGNLMLLGKKNRKRKTDITDTGYCDFHIYTP